MRPCGCLSCRCVTCRGGKWPVEVGRRESHFRLVVDRSPPGWPTLSLATLLPLELRAFKVLLFAAALGQVTSASLAFTLRKSVTTVCLVEITAQEGAPKAVFCGCVWLRLLLPLLPVAWLPL